MSDVTLILQQIEDGDPSAAEQLLPLVYDELRKLAAARMAQESPDQTLQATGLVHEACVRLLDGNRSQHWDSRGHFFAAAAEAMRRILVENARRKRGPSRRRDRVRVDLIDVAAAVSTPPEDLIALDEALTRFAQIAPEKAELVKLRFFAGMTIPEAAATLGVSHATAERYWSYARVWLYAELSGDEHQPKI